MSWIDQPIEPRFQRFVSAAALIPGAMPQASNERAPLALYRWPSSFNVYLRREYLQAGLPASG